MPKKHAAQDAGGMIQSMLSGTLRAASLQMNSARARAPSQKSAFFSLCNQIPLVADLFDLVHLCFQPVHVSLFVS